MSTVVETGVATIALRPFHFIPGRGLVKSANMTILWL